MLRATVSIFRIARIATKQISFSPEISKIIADNNIAMNVGQTTRRGFLSAVAATALSLLACKRTGSFKPADILDDLQDDPAIKKLRRGDLTFNYKETISPNGKPSFSIIQRGLFALKLITTNPEDFNFGVYGNETALAILRLQVWAKNNNIGGTKGIQNIEGANGQKFSQPSLFALEQALKIKIAARKPQ